MEIFHFFKNWEGLFGTDIDSTQIDLHANNEYINFYIWQKKLIHKKYRFANDPFLILYFKSNGTLWKIVSSLIPETEIEEPSRINMNNIMKNIIGKTLVIENGSHAENVLFNSEYDYNDIDGFWIYLKKRPDEYLLYLLKGIRAMKEVWECHYATYDILCHPYTNEVIHIKTYGID
jgi:hypothetical protein